MKKRGKLAYIREILYDYPVLKKKKTLNPQEQQRIKVVDDVLAEIGKLKNADDIIALINLVYFTDKHYKLSDAAYIVLISERTAYRYNKNLMYLMSNKLELI